MFTKPDGAPFHPELVRQALHRCVARTPVPRIRFHDLRHTHATLLLKAGVPPTVVSERLGHASVAFTMEIYAHVIPGMQSEAADMFREDPDFLHEDDALPPRVLVNAAPEFVTRCVQCCYDLTDRIRTAEIASTQWPPLAQCVGEAVASRLGYANLQPAKWFLPFSDTL